eukprot:scaffold2069_cov254-Pinguiococcus_pyrenoidosus.AAC.29
MAMCPLEGIQLRHRLAIHLWLSRPSAFILDPRRRCLGTRRRGFCAVRSSLIDGDTMYIPKKYRRLVHLPLAILKRLRQPFPAKHDEIGFDPGQSSPPPMRQGEVGLRGHVGHLPRQPLRHGMLHEGAELEALEGVVTGAAGTEAIMNRRGHFVAATQDVDLKLDAGVIVAQDAQVGVPGQCQSFAARRLHHAHLPGYLDCLVGFALVSRGSPHIHGARCVSQLQRPVRERRYPGTRLSPALASLTHQLVCPLFCRLAQHGLQGPCDTQDAWCAVAERFLEVSAAAGGVDDHSSLVFRKGRLRHETPLQLLFDTDAARQTLDPRLEDVGHMRDVVGVGAQQVGALAQEPHQWPFHRALDRLHVRLRWGDGSARRELGKVRLDVGDVRALVLGIGTRRLGLSTPTLLVQPKCLVVVQRLWRRHAFRALAPQVHQLIPGLPRTTAQDLRRHLEARRLDPRHRHRGGLEDLCVGVGFLLGRIHRLRQRGDTSGPLESQRGRVVLEGVHERQLVLPQLVAVGLAPQLGRKVRQ